MSEDAATWKVKDDAGGEPVETMSDPVENKPEPELVHERT